MGKIYIEQNDLNLAIKNYKNILNKDPKDHESLYHISKIYFKVGQTERTKKYLK
jgi:Tfp pilus assembly protein PilF